MWKTMGEKYNFIKREEGGRNLVEREGEILWVILYEYIIQALSSRGLAKQPAKVSRQHYTPRGFDIHLENKVYFPV